MLEQYAGICKRWSLKLGEIIGNIYNLMLNKKIRQNYTAFENYVYLLVNSKGDVLHHLINNMCGFSVGIRQMV